MKPKTLLLSIHSSFADKIFCGLKTMELRRVRPRVSEGSIVLVYVTAPRMALVGAFEVSDVVESTPDEIWRGFNSQSCIAKNDFDAYFAGTSRGYGIEISNAWTFEQAIPLSAMKSRIPGFSPPQGYRYLSFEELEKLSLNGQVASI